MEGGMEDRRGGCAVICPYVHTITAQTNILKLFMNVSPSLSLLLPTTTATN